MKREKQAHGGVLQRLEKGDVINPKGKIPGTLSFKKLFRQFLAEEITIEDLNEKSGKRVMSRKHAAVFLAAKTASDDNEDPAVRLRHLETIMKKLDGDTVQKIELKNKGGANSGEVSQDQIDQILKALGNGSTDDAKHSKAASKSKG